MSDSEIYEIEPLPPRPKREKTGGRLPGSKNRFSKDIRETIHQAFWKAGGRDYLVRVAHKRPDVFAQLLGKTIPTETKVSLLASYQGIPVQVEDRDGLLPLHGPDVASGAVIDAIAHAVQDAATAQDDDWLA